jgi:hypothetical protein
MYAAPIASQPTHHSVARGEPIRLGRAAHDEETQQQERNGYRVPCSALLADAEQGRLVVHEPRRTTGPHPANHRGRCGLTMNMKKYQEALVNLKNFTGICT